MVIVGQADHNQFVDPSLPKHKGLERTGSTSVAVAKWVHCSDVVMERHRLNKAVVLPELGNNGIAECVKCGMTVVTALNTSALWRTKSDVPTGRPQRAWFTFVVITAGHDTPMDVQDELLVDRVGGRLRTQPAIGGFSRPELPLRVGQVMTPRRLGGQGFILFPLGKFRAFYSRRTYGLKAQLLLVDLRDPLR